MKFTASTKQLAGVESVCFIPMARNHEGFDLEQELFPFVMQQDFWLRLDLLLSLTLAVWSRLPISQVLFSETFWMSSNLKCVRIFSGKAKCFLLIAIAIVISERG